MARSVAHTRFRQWTRPRPGSSDRPDCGRAQTRPRYFGKFAGSHACHDRNQLRAIGAIARYLSPPPRSKAQWWGRLLTFEFVVISEDEGAAVEGDRPSFRDRPLPTVMSMLDEGVAEVVDDDTRCPHRAAQRIHLLQDHARTDGKASTAPRFGSRGCAWFGAHPTNTAGPARRYRHL